MGRAACGKGPSPQRPPNQALTSVALSVCQACLISGRWLGQVSPARARAEGCEGSQGHLEVASQAAMVVAIGACSKCPLPARLGCGRGANSGPALSDPLPWSVNQAVGTH